jgi:hypothetical protein
MFSFLFGGDKATKEEGKKEELQVRGRMCFTLDLSPFIRYTSEAVCPCETPLIREGA